MVQTRWGQEAQGPYIQYIKSSVHPIDSSWGVASTSKTQETVIDSQPSPSAPVSVS